MATPREASEIVWERVSDSEEGEASQGSDETIIGPHGVSARVWTPSVSGSLSGRQELGSPSEPGDAWPGSWSWEWSSWDSASTWEVDPWSQHLDSHRPGWRVRGSNENWEEIASSWSRSSDEASTPPPREVPLPRLLGAWGFAAEDGGLGRGALLPDSHRSLRLDPQGHLWPDPRDAPRWASKDEEGNGRRLSAVHGLFRSVLPVSAQELQWDSVQHLPPDSVQGLQRDSIQHLLPDSTQGLHRDSVQHLLPDSTQGHRQGPVQSLLPDQAQGLLQVRPGQLADRESRDDKQGRQQVNTPPLQSGDLSSSENGGEGRRRDERPDGSGSFLKLHSSFPPAFYAKPGESWKDYWRTVEFWLASEGAHLPANVRAARLMQQLKERAGKIVNHLRSRTLAEIMAWT